MGHIRDVEFIRDKVPMTKSEVRAISVAKLDLREDSVLIDVGAGSGSIGIEASTYISCGHVYGVEVNPVAVNLIGRNLEKFGIENYTLIEGMVPMNLKDITFDRMFIGGSKGNLRGIVEYFLRNSKKESILVVNAIVLETLEEIKRLMKEYGFLDVEIVSVTVARNKKIAEMNMMMGENPIYIVSGRRGE